MRPGVCIGDRPPPALAFQAELVAKHIGAPAAQRAAAGVGPDVAQLEAVLSSARSRLAEQEAELERLRLAVAVNRRATPHEAALLAHADAAVARTGPFAEQGGVPAGLGTDAEDLRLLSSAGGAAEVAMQPRPSSEDEVVELAAVRGERDIYKARCAQTIQLQASAAREAACRACEASTEADQAGPLTHPPCAHLQKVSPRA